MKIQGNMMKHANPFTTQGFTLLNTIKMLTCIPLKVHA